MFYDSLIIISGVISLFVVIAIIGTYIKVGKIVELLQEINSKLDAQKISKKDE